MSEKIVSTIFHIENHDGRGWIRQGHLSFGTQEEAEQRMNCYGPWEFGPQLITMDNPDWRIVKVTAFVREEVVVKVVAFGVGNKVVRPQP